MEQTTEVVRLTGNKNYVCFFCPGCNEPHMIKISGGDNWTWNNSMDKPTFSPSVLVTSGHYSPRFVAGDECWCTFDRKFPEREHTFHCQRCHSFVTDGRIRFLGDCSHDLANQTVGLPPYPSALES